MGSVAALKYSVVGLYLLVLLILVGIFILAGEAGPAPPGALPEPGASMGLESRLGRVSRAIQGRKSWDPAELQGALSSSGSGA